MKLFSRFMLILYGLLLLTRLSKAFVPTTRYYCAAPRRHFPLLHMGKGFRSAQNKQAALARKLEQAKKQQSSGENNNNNEKPADKNNPIKENKDEQKKNLMEQEFKMLLAKSPPPPPQQPREASSSNMMSPTGERIFAKRNAALKSNQNTNSDTPKLKARDAKKRKKRAAETTTSSDDDDDDETKGRRQLQEGDQAQRIDFESLVSLDTNQPLGPIEAAKLVPWVPPFLKDYLIVLADPRQQSSDLRQAVQYLSSQLDESVLEQVIVVTSDSRAEIQAWLSRSGLLQKESSSSSCPIQFFGDSPQLDWMTTHSCVGGNDRWSLSILVFDTDGTLQTLVSQVDPTQACATVASAVNAISLSSSS